MDMTSRLRDMQQARKASSDRDDMAMMHILLLAAASASIVAAIFTGTTSPLAFLAVAFAFLASYSTGRSAELHGQAAVAYVARANSTAY